MNTTDTASYEVWRATDDGAECVATTTTSTEAHDRMRKRGDAIVLRGDVIAVKYGLHTGLRRTIAHVAKFAPRDASGALIQTATPTPPAEEAPAVHEDPVKTKDKGPETAPPPCTVGPRKTTSHRAEPVRISQHIRCHEANIVPVHRIGCARIAKACPDLHQRVRELRRGLLPFAFGLGRIAFGRFHARRGNDSCDGEVTIGNRTCGSGWQAHM